MSKKTLCITPGDPAGIGPEVTVKFLSHHLQNYPETQFLIVGSYTALQRAATTLGISLPVSSQIQYHAIEQPHPGDVAYHAILEAVRHIVNGEATALVTGPIAKNNLAEAGHGVTGHTEILDSLAKQYFPQHSGQAEMLFVYRHFRMLLLTRHLPLVKVCETLTLSAVTQSLSILCDFLKTQAGLAQPKIALLGVNPHAGEIGGEEEQNILVPAMAEISRQYGAQLEGPFAADGFFRGFSLTDQFYDAVVAAYHDQGLIPFKLLTGHHAVNVTIGLPFIRTSVGHGTGFDIAGKGIADETSLIEAINVALALTPIETKAS